MSITKPARLDCPYCGKKLLFEQACGILCRSESKKGTEYYNTRCPGGCDYFKINAIREQETK